MYQIDDTPIKVLTAWVRIPNVAEEYFDINFLHKIGAKIGKVLRVDRNSAHAERGQFTRISVEIDLTKPLLSKFWLKGKVWKIQYEGLRMVCFTCGKLGHNTEGCPSTKAPSNDEPMRVEEAVQGHSNATSNHTQRPEEDEDFGAWMLVKEPVRKRLPRPEKNTVVTGKTTGNGAKTQLAGGARSAIGVEKSANPISTNFMGANQANGSRYILKNKKDKEVEAIKESFIFGKDNTQVVEDIRNSFDTVNLGDNSQNKIQDLSFKLGNYNHNAIKSKKNKTPPKLYKEKRRVSALEGLEALQESTNIATPQRIVTRILRRGEGKENNINALEATTKTTSLPNPDKQEQANSCYLKKT